MKKVIIPAVAALVIGFAGLTWADPAMGSAGTSNTASPTGNPLIQGKAVSGSVTNIDTVNNSIQVKDTKGAIQTVVMDQNAVVTKNGKNATINDLKVGDVVSVKMAPSPTPGS